MDQADLNNLLRLVKLIGGKFILVEDGQPKVVLMSYEDFQELAIPGAIRKVVESASRLEEEVNKQITTAQLLDLREEVIQDLPGVKVEPLAPLDNT